MYEERQAEYPCSGVQQEQEVDGNSPIAVQWVKANAAAGRVEYRISEQVIHIYDNSTEQDQDGPHPLGGIERIPQQYGQEKVDAIMEDGLIHG